MSDQDLAVIVLQPTLSIKDGTLTIDNIFVSEGTTPLSFSGTFEDSDNVSDIDLFVFTGSFTRNPVDDTAPNNFTIKTEPITGIPTINFSTGDGTFVGSITSTISVSKEVKGTGSWSFKSTNVT